MFLFYLIKFSLKNYIIENNNFLKIIIKKKMGCYEVKNSRNNLAKLTCIFDLENETQKTILFKIQR